MKKNRQLIVVVWFLFLVTDLSSQNFTSYFTGNELDASTISLGGICLMGGASEDDNAMTWFLQQASGGDILVLRVTGSDGYNDYLFSELGLNVNSVETIVMHNAAAADETYIHERISKAEGIWFAGGDQWDYINFWRGTAIDSLINRAIVQRNIVVGGISAGMAVQGSHYFSAQNGTIRSEVALANPFDQNITVDSTQFLENQYLENVITDTHYDNPDRRGRHVVFLSRMLHDYDINPRGIACDEFTAVCIDVDGIARVFGSYPEYEDNAYFIQVNCKLEDAMPEIIETGQSLTWNKSNEALKVYKVKGTEDGNHTFDLNDWETATGGEWQNWYVEDGTLFEANTVQQNCSLVNSQDFKVNQKLTIFPNPTLGQLIVDWSNLNKQADQIKLYNTTGSLLKEVEIKERKEANLNLSYFRPGIYFGLILYQDGTRDMIKLIKMD